MIKAQELREKFIKFFEKKGHKVLPSSSLIPQDDPSVLLTTAGMQQFKKWFSGLEKPAYPRVVTVQKCVRIGDIEEVGDDTHLSFFEMLGNFSFGDYFKEDAIKWGIKFIQDELGIDFSRMSFTYFEGDKETPADKDSLKILKDLSISDEKIKGMGREDNFWGPTGDEGPCGPTVEIYVDGVEVWNLVFNQYYKTKEGEYKTLDFNGVDTGLGFERLLAILNKKDNPYETELFLDLIKKIEELETEKSSHSERVIADHLRSATFLLADGVLPSNLDKGYVSRRLIRRAIRYGRLLGIEENFTPIIAEAVIKDYQETYPELGSNREKILEELKREEDKFRKTLETGLKFLLKELKRIRFDKERDKQILVGEGGYSFKKLGILAFNMFQTYGFPLEMTHEVLNDLFKVQHLGLTVDFVWLQREFEREFQRHQELSRKGAEKKFKGGLATGGEQETKYHTATHLLHQALRTVLGDHVKQAGSNIIAERLRFDFTNPQKLTPEEVTEVENLVNEQIKAGLSVTCEEMSVKEAQEKGAIGLFEEKYGEKVKVYTIGPSARDAHSGSREFFSREICGGPHVKNTGELGHFKITKEEASSAGVRRIKAILE